MQELGVPSTESPVARGATVVVDHVRKAFEAGRVQALRDVTFRIGAGEMVALTGASGSGKSTLLNLVGALDRPDAGSIVVDGRDLDELDDAAAYRAATVGFVFQAHNLLPTLTAAENVQMAMFAHLPRGRRLPRSQRTARAHELLAEVGLGDRADAHPAVLSGGERQRVAIARALANEPRLLLADEPTGALDSENGARVLDLLERLRRLHGMTALLVTNDDGVAARADRVLRIADGVIAPLEGPPA